MTAPERAATVRRLRKIEGQVRGLIRMIEQDRYCIDVLHQISAVRAALTRAESEILRQHAASCVEDAIASGDVDVQRRKFSELVRLFEGVRG
jgi:DNA-binding FrmR family transcriptional regulator